MIADIIEIASNPIKNPCNAGASFCLRFHRRHLFWMLVVETIAKIRRLSLVQGKSIREICRELRISRKVVRKVLRSDATEFRYERDAEDRSLEE